jgi:hypothetical protein
MKVNKVGISIFLISSIICLFLLEFGLRLAGNIYLSNRETRFEKVDSQLSYDTERDYEEFRLGNVRNENIIWAIGDSFTNAGNVDSLDSYPAYLFRELNKNDYNYRVVNLGQCEDPTWGVYERLNKQLKLAQEQKSLPKVVVFLTGVSDPFYYLFSGTSPIEREGQSIQPFETKNVSWYRKLRIYKVYRHIKLSFLNKQLVQEFSKMTPDVMKDLDSLYLSIVENKSSAQNWNEIKNKVKSILRGHKEFVDGSKGEFDFNDKDRFILNTIVIPLTRGYSSRMDYNKALDVLIRFSKDYADFFWSDKRNHPFVLHTISQIMMFQSEYTPKEMIEHVNDSTSKNPSLRKSKLFKQALKMFSDRKDLDNIILKTKEQTWEKIINLSLQYDFKIVLQTYASDFKQVNSFIRKLSKDKQLSLVDNHILFRPHVKKYGREVLFADDNHFLPLGYEIMAKNVFEQLKKSKFIKKK